ncbi:MAG: hypothetical protein ACJ78D_07180 [Gemmatimonadaceae bacterium]
MKIGFRTSRAMLFGLASLAFIAAPARSALAQRDSSRLPKTAAKAATPELGSSSGRSFWRRFAVGFGASILAHEAAHMVSSMAMGFHPHFAFDKGRPTVFSGIDSELYPHKQFIFSASGLTTQALMNEAILDIPHSQGGPIERGVLAGGIATTLFYITIGRNASVSDISFMARTSSLSKTQLSLIFGGFSAIQAWRISRNPAYDHFFVRPGSAALEVGLSY